MLDGLLQCKINPATPLRLERKYLSVSAHAHYLQKSTWNVTSIQEM